MGLRLELQALLLAITSNVYFQPPNTLIMKYPCIRYERDNSFTGFADNYPYRRVKRYIVTVITKEPDSPIPDAVAQLPMTTHNRFYTADNLNHDVFNVYF